MIEDKKLGVKIAETPEEQKWENIKQRATEAIAGGRIEIEINQAIIELAEKKLKELRKDKGKYIG